MFPIILFTAAFALAQEPVDDQALRESMETKGALLIKENKLVSNAILQKELETRKANFQIPKSFNLCKNSGEIYDRVKKGTIVVCSYSLCGKCEKQHANPAGGFILSPDGLAVTNHHVMSNKDASGFVAFTSDGRALRVLKVLASDPNADVAVIQLEGTGLPYLPVAEKAEIGSRVWVMSHPAGKFYTLTSGVASRYAMMRRTPWLEITADYAVGSSGSPIVNDQGQVVSIVSMTETITASDKANGVQMVRKITVPTSAIRNLIGTN